MNPNRKLALFDNMLAWICWHCEMDWEYVEALHNCGFTTSEIRQLLDSHAGMSQKEIDYVMHVWGEEFGEDVESN